MRALPVLLLACSSPAPAPRAAPVVIATPALTAGDFAVATVNQHPVWASCVATQAAGLTGSEADRRRAALAQCEAFELLAQEAEQRGLADAPEVREAARAAQVNRLVELDFEQRYQTPADLKRPIDLVMSKNEWRMHILELRASTYARFIVPDKAPADVDARAHALADRLAAELAGQTGLYNVHLTEAAQRLAQGSDIKIESLDVKPMHQDDLVDEYARALYGIPEVGQTSRAVRTKWGWDVVLWTGGVTAKERTRDEVVADLFPEIRRRQFQLWVTQISRSLGVKIDIDQANVAAMDSEDSK